MAAHLFTYRAGTKGHFLLSAHTTTLLFWNCGLQPGECKHLSDYVKIYYGACKIEKNMYIKH
jgi:hypothetical protein